MSCSAPEALDPSNFQSSSTTTTLVSLPPEPADAQLATTANTSHWADWNAKREADRRLEAAFTKSTSRERVAAERLACSGVDE